jgi:ABC-2 type transport system ATP-binding protein
MVSIKNVSKKYGDILAVSNLSLEIKNEFFVFLGPNGAGKTTTIKMMTGLVAPSSGDVFLNGTDLAGEPLVAKRTFGLVPEEPAFYDKLRVYEFLEFISTIYKVPPNLFLNRVEKLFEIFELTEKREAFIEELSHGTKQKISIISALLHGPKILVLDEPTSGLDPHAVRNLKSILRGLVDRGTTVFMSTHILEIAEQMCDRIGIIYKGKLLATGTLDELKSQAALPNGSLEQVFLSLTGYKFESQIGDFLGPN